MIWLMLSAARAETIELTLRHVRGSRTEHIEVDPADADGHMLLWEERHSRRAHSEGSFTLAQGDEDDTVQVTCSLKTTIQGGWRSPGPAHYFREVSMHLWLRPDGFVSTRVGGEFFDCTARVLPVTGR